MERAALIGEQKEELAAVGVLRVVDDPIFDLADMGEVMQAKMKNQRLGGRHDQAPLPQRFRCLSEWLLAIRALKFEIERPIYCLHDACSLMTNVSQVHDELKFFAVGRCAPSVPAGTRVQFDPG